MTNTFRANYSTSFEQALLYLARGEEFAVEMPTLPNFVNPNLVQQLNVVFKKDNKTNSNTIIGNIYPNPAHESLTLMYQLGDKAQATFYLFDGTGRLVNSCLMIGQGNLSLSANNLSNGIYYYRVINNGEVLQQDKFIVIK